MSRRTSSRSTLTMVPSTMSPSLKYLMVLSMAARKSSAEPMSLRATCGEVTEGLGMWWVAPDRFDRRDSCYWLRRRADVVLRTRDLARTSTRRDYSPAYTLDKLGSPSAFRATPLRRGCC